MDYLYLPVDTSGHCVEVQSGEVLRVYDDAVPELETPVTFTDYYINSHYLDVSGSTILTESAYCIDNDRFTTSFQYRVDFPQIMLMVFIFIFILYFIISSLVKPFFRRVK